MAPKKPQAEIHYIGTCIEVPQAEIHYIGTCIEVPTNQKYSSSSSSSSRGRQLMESSEMENSEKSIFKDVYGKSSSGFNRSYKREEFIDKSSGRLGYKAEVKYTRTNKYDDMEEGYTHEYQTQVKHKHVAYPSNKQGFSSTNKKGNKKSIDYY
ncbi:hypothetical protein L484_019126 [Morus notabilis]|uniref:Uncharacterized protein n=1 Tax=Morus notabilis TaxID=981085 RepID=W9SLP6_9ROSA|nr:hypothetical protein L484_019126 [Morus notabilis]